MEVAQYLILMNLEITLKMLLNYQKQAFYSSSIIEISSDKIISLGESAIDKCSKLKNIYLPNVKSVGQWAVASCPLIKKIEFPLLLSITTEFTVNDNSLVYCDISSVTRLEIKSFYSKYNLKKLLTGDITYFDDQCLDSCVNLVMSINLSIATYIGKWSFSKCCNIIFINTDMKFITSLPDGSFFNCSKLNNIHLYEISSIGGQTFYDCDALQYIIIESVKPPTLGSQSFDNTNDCSIYVPDESISAYQSATNWSNYSSRIKALSSFIQ